MEAATSDFEIQIKQAKTREELDVIAEKFGLQIDRRMNVENARTAMLESMRSIHQEVDRVTKESAETIKTDADPIVRFKFRIMDINNPDESPLFGFNFAPPGTKITGTIPRFEFMHGTIVEAPMSVYEHLKKLTIPRSKWVADTSSPTGQKCVEYEQNRFNCDLELSRDEVLNLQKTRAA